MTQSISAFWGNPDAIRRVFPVKILDRLSSIAGLRPKPVLCRSGLDREVTAEVRFLFGTWGFEVLSEEEIRTYFPNLEAVFYAAGSVQAFARPFLHCGVRVFSAWAANAVPVAEYTLAQILLANKGFFQLSYSYSQNGLAQWGGLASAFPGNYGCKVGIIGAGMIGKLVIQMLKSHELDVMVYDPFLSDELARELGIEKAPLEQLFSECQTISNHLANNPQTVGLLNYDLFSRMKPGAVFLNTGRGAQVVEEDLCRVMSEREDLAAVLDVTWPEPPQGHLFYQLPNVTLTPHIAGSLGNEVRRMAVFMAEECERFVSGSPCRYEVTESMLETMA
jgi:phosphoglycerate dehydrogenase-like enzyme